MDPIFVLRLHTEYEPTGLLGVFSDEGLAVKAAHEFMEHRHADGESFVLIEAGRKWSYEDYAQTLVVEERVLNTGTCRGIEFCRYKLND